jgi:RimJ/RimL family protein N-acetyltransferase
MPHPIWPFFDLRVVTPRLELVAIDDHVAAELALLAARGVHAPEFMPFAFPWTDAPSPELERKAMQFHWRCRAETAPEAWNLNLGVVVGGQLVGSTGLITHDFPVTRRFETGSWLGLEFQGRGIGKEMRVATLQLGFLGFGAALATTAAFHDNAPSLGVTRSLGYVENGHDWKVRRGQPARSLQFEMSRDQFDATLRRDDIELLAVEPCLAVLGLNPRTD